MDDDVEAMAELVIVRNEDALSRDAYPGLTRRVLAYNESLMLVEHTMVRGSEFPRHSHVQDQLAYLLSGRVRVQCGDEEFEACQGDSFVVRGNIEHQVVALEDSVALDVFNGMRQEYIPWVTRQ